MSDLLHIEHLTVEYTHGETHVTAVKNVNLRLKPGRTLGIVGESGCGKSTLALAVMNLLSPEESRKTGSITFNGKKMAMIFQDPFSSLNPVMKIRDQIEECGVSSEKARLLLKHVQLPAPERILSSYPHQLSGGQRQRVMIAIALALKPDLLIADEPTTALDVTVQMEIMELLEKIQKDMNMSMIFVTHNMGLVKNISDDLAVMLNGEIVETGKTKTVLTKPTHAYTKMLLGCVRELAL